jgi:hypothetical protein
MNFVTYGKMVILIFMLYLKKISIFSRVIVVFANYKLDRIFLRNYKSNWNIDSSQNYTGFGSFLLKLKKK